MTQKSEHEREAAFEFDARWAGWTPGSFDSADSAQDDTKIDDTKSGKGRPIICLSCQGEVDASSSRRRVRVRIQNSERRSLSMRPMQSSYSR